MPASKFNPVAFTASAIASGKASTRDAVDDQPALFCGQFDFIGQRGNASCGANAAHRAVGDNQQIVHRQQRAARNVFESRFAVEHNVAVVAREAVQYFAQHIVGETVAALAFGASHDDQVVAFLLYERCLDPQVQKFLLRYALQRLYFLAGAFANAAHAGVVGNSECFVQVGVRVGIDGEHRRLTVLHQPAQSEG